MNIVFLTDSNYMLIAIWVNISPAGLMYIHGINRLTEDEFLECYNVEFD